ncbi:MAG: DUF1674 domain-containing protein [Sphingomonadaceae bacterium]
MATVAPRRASASASARPIPLAAPVSAITLPSSDGIGCFPSPSRCAHASRTGMARRPSTPKNQVPPRKPPAQPVEVGGREGPEPTRYGDWEVKGICTDF